MPNNAKLATQAQVVLITGMYNTLFLLVFMISVEHIIGSKNKS